MSLPDKLIIFLGRTCSGHHHDYRMLKQELPPGLDWFADLHIRVDLAILALNLLTVVLRLPSRRRSRARVQSTPTRH
jgi:hypothetical protein